jgi:hypothetical protein
MKRKPVLRLQIARRTAFGSLTAAEEQTGVYRSTQQRAESGVSVSPRVRRQIEKIYGAPLEDLQKVFLASIVGNDQ